MTMTNPTTLHTLKSRSGSHRSVRSGCATAITRLAALTLIASLLAAGCAPASGKRLWMTRALAKAGLPDLTAEDAPAGAIWLDTLDLDDVDQEWRCAQPGCSVDGKPLTLNGQVFAHGVGSHACSEMVIDLKGAAERFHAVVGLDDEVNALGSVVFSVVVDGEEVRQTDVLRGSDDGQIISVDLTGSQQMTLLIGNGGDDINYDHADWAGAMLVLAPEATERPETAKLPPAPAPPIILPRQSAPAIHAPRINGATPRRPFLFRIPASGKGPLRFATEDLPDGLELDPQSGIISGSLTDEGTTAVKVTVEGATGEAASTLTIVGGADALALTPPMGWNSWNVWGTSVDDAKVRQAADWMVKSGLAAHGYQYINIDDAWEGERGDDERIQCNEKFPDMKALADYVHAKGLKLGIYSSPGPKTCAGYEGSYGYERLDARTYAEWGIDLLKYDWCSYGEIAEDDSEEEFRKPYEVMREALDECGRDIVYSLCQYGRGNVSTWGDAVGGNYWRTTGDIQDSWSSMSGIGFRQNGLEPFAGPGHWNDPDMLVVGQVGWGPDLHPTRLTPNEQLTHMTLWSLLASPLLIGCDLAQLDDFTLAILTNPDVLEVSQDPLGRQALRVSAVERTEVWARPLVDGTLAVGLFNRGRTDANITASWSDLGLSGPQPVRNLWLRRDEGTYDGAYSTTVPRHGAVMLRIGQTAGLR